MYPKHAVQCSVALVDVISVVPLRGQSDALPVDHIYEEVVFCILSVHSKDTCEFGYAHGGSRRGTSL
jgi:hypothetical protein